MTASERFKSESPPWGGWLVPLSVIALCILVPMTPSVPVWTESTPYVLITAPPSAHPMQIVNCELSCGCFVRTPEGLTAAGQE